jgi:transcriptional regulator with XRE-family HTH domain
MAKSLPNYLRTYRKRAGFTQREVAFLLGGRWRTKVSEYEYFRRYPSLETQFAYQLIFHTPVHELFPGIYAEVERETTRRARLLIEKLNRLRPTAKRQRKLESLATAFPDVSSRHRTPHP